ncbi:hypothetical protein DICA1_A08636 [Diutina catenulata]
MELSSHMTSALHRDGSPSAMPGFGPGLHGLELRGLGDDDPGLLSDGDSDADRVAVKRARHGSGSGSVSGPSQPVSKADLKVLADGKVLKVQKTRQRRILSCVYCHSKKIKCSRDQPICKKCQQLGIECKYFINERVSRGGKRSARRQSVISEGSASDSAPYEPTKPFEYKPEDSPVKKEEPMKHEALIEHEAFKSEPFKQEAFKQEFIKGTSPGVIHDLPYFNFYNTPDEPKRGGATPNMNTLQTPIMNNLSNNITNNYFKTNYSNRPKDAQAAATATQVAEDHFSFNLSTFTFNNDGFHGIQSPGPTNGTVQTPQAPRSGDQAASTAATPVYFNRNVTNFFDNPGTAAPETAVSAVRQNGTVTNPGLHNSLNAYSSNPATSVNYLYGSNTYYRNDNLLEDLNDYLPVSAERSLELIERYCNSVHILLPIVINLNEFRAEHERYWRIRKEDASSPGGSAKSSPADHPNFNFLEFYTLYFPILYASTISEFEEYDNLLLNQDINKYLKAFNKVCQYYNYPHGLKTIGLLLGNVIIQSTSPNPSTLEMSQIIRYAKFLQLHKDPVITLRITNWEVVKFRRLLWWVIFGLDALTSHNFCLPPVCRSEDFNVVMPEEDEPVYEDGEFKEKKLNVGILSLNVKFTYDRILSELVYHLHNGLSSNITPAQVNEIKDMILGLFKHIHRSIARMNHAYKVTPPKTVQEMNLINFISNHSWSFVDRATMLLHKKILMGEAVKRDYAGGLFGGTPPASGSVKAADDDAVVSKSGLLGALSLTKYEDTFGHLSEANIIKNFNNSSISQLKFNQFEDFSYENMHNNLIPSILHNLNDFLKYNDFIKFGKYNWYVKRTIPLDSIILMFVIIAVKFKYEFMQMAELCIYVKLINKALFILNRKWFKNEKYKRMLSLTNLTWEYTLKRYNVIALINHFNEANKVEGGAAPVEYFDYQVTSYPNLNDLFNVMDVPQPVQPHDSAPPADDIYLARDSPSDFFASLSGPQSVKFGGFPRKPDDIVPVMPANQLARVIPLSSEVKAELSQLNEKIYYDLRNNFVDINDYCAFYTSLEHILHELMDYINQG